MTLGSCFPVAMENDPRIDHNLKPLRSHAESLSMMHGFAYLCPPGNQGDITSFL